MHKIGFIGLGIMGKPMSKNLLRAGYDLCVYDIRPEPVDEVARGGAERCVSAGDVAVSSSVVITMLPDSREVREVLLGANGVIENARPGTLIIDMSSIAPLASVELEAQARERGLRMIDAPVSGGEPKAIDGTLSIMVGGSQADFDEALPILRVMGSSVVRVGGVGSGNVAKLANQVIVALNIAAVSEALVLAAKAGVDPEVVYHAIRGGLAGSAVLDAKTPMMLAGSYKPGFKIDLHIKDLRNALETAKKLGVTLFLSSQVFQILEAVRAKGEGQSDHSAIVRFYEDLSNAHVSKAGCV